MAIVKRYDGERVSVQMYGLGEYLFTEDQIDKLMARLVEAKKEFCK